MLQKFWGGVVNVLRNSWLYIVLVVAALALFYLAFSLNRTDIWAVMAAGTAFGCLITLFLAARGRPALVAPKPEVRTTLVTPNVLINEVRAAALVTYGQIGTVTVKKNGPNPIGAA